MRLSPGFFNVEINRHMSQADLRVKYVGHGRTYADLIGFSNGAMLLRKIQVFSHWQCLISAVAPYEPSNARRSSSFIMLYSAVRV
jgi:hypothetical protein